MGSGIRLYTTCRQCVEKIRAYWWTARIRSHGCTRPIHCRQRVHYLCDTIESRGLIRILYFYIYIRCTHTATYSTRIAIHSQKWILKTAAAAAKKKSKIITIAATARTLNAAMMSNVKTDNDVLMNSNRREFFGVRWKFFFALCLNRKSNKFEINLMLRWSTIYTRFLLFCLVWRPFSLSALGAELNIGFWSFSALKKKR